jgi:GNAT superfamily N-acetyltransferase
MADSILARLVTTRRVATVADRMFARRMHHFAYRDLVERQFGAWVEEQQDGFFEASWAAQPNEIILFEGEPCGYVCVEDRPGDVHLRELVVAPDYQGRGIGSIVLDAVIDHARTRRVPVRLGTHQGESGRQPVSTDGLPSNRHHGNAPSFRMERC